MALKDFLSAVRVIILDLEDLPEEYGKRHALYRHTFPKLLAEEIEDLAKIDPQRFKTYTTSIFLGESGILDNHFDLTLALLKKHWGEFFPGEFDKYTLVRALHKARPWDSSRAHGFAKNFLSFLSDDLPALRSKYPVILDAARLELLNLEVKRHPNPQFSAQHSLAKEDIAALAVAELLNLPFYIPPYARFGRFAYDVTTARRALLMNEGKLSSEISHTETFCIGGRTVKNLARWINLPQEVWLFLQGRANSSAVELGALAEQFIGSADQSRPEEILFREFMELLLNLMDGGIVVVRKDFEITSKLQTAQHTPVQSSVHSEHSG